MNIFPKWTNHLPTIALILVIVLSTLAVGIVWYWFSPKNTDVGYAPLQPVPYSHKLHVGELGMDCRYCHANVERSPAATIPPTQVCMNCHKIIKADSPNILKLRESFDNNRPMAWKKVHNLPDYAYFDHSRHVLAGISCVSCHGRIDKMAIVHQVQPLSMRWCLDCHRAPEYHLRPLAQITQLDWKAEDQLSLGLQIKKEKNIHPREACSVCHR